jgi:D-alanine-D-alanine ligase
MSASGRCLVFTAVVPGEEEDPANSTGAIAGALVETLAGLGWAAEHRKFDGDLNVLLADLRQHPPGFVFNLVESFLATDRLAFMATGIFETAGIAFAGSGSFGMMAGTDKIIAKRMLDRAGIATPSFAEGPHWRGLEETRRYIVKAVAEHASLGLDGGAVVAGRAAVEARAAAYEAQHKARVFAEEYIDGREFNVAMIEMVDGPVVLPLAEMDFTGFPEDRPRIVDYAAKWKEDSAEYRFTNRRFIDEAAEAELAAKLKRTALEVWGLFDLGGWARVDFRIDDSGAPLVIDINVNPDVSHDAGLAAAAARAGISYRQLIELIVQAGMRRAQP